MPKAKVEKKPWTKRRVSAVRKTIREAFEESRAWIGNMDPEVMDDVRERLDREEAEAMELLKVFSATLEK